MSSVNETAHGRNDHVPTGKNMPILKTSKTKAVIYPGANSEKVYQLFCKGRIDCFYPSIKLEELEYFPINFKKAINGFIQKTRSKGKYIYLQFTSSIPDWEEETKLPYHVIRIGIANSHGTSTTSSDGVHC